MKRALTLLIVVCAISVSASQSRQSGTHIYRLAELRWPQIDALDRERTMFIMPMGRPQEHGPHLPIGSDTFGGRSKRTASRGVWLDPCRTGTSS